MSCIPDSNTRLVSRISHISDFHFISLRYRGSSGDTFRAIQAKTSVSVCVKIVRTQTQKWKSCVMRELRASKLLNDAPASILTVRDIISPQSRAQWVALIAPWCEFSLEDILWKAISKLNRSNPRFLPFDDIRNLLRHILEALVFLDSRNIVHRDITPSNILWSAERNSWTLCDFGSSSIFGARVSFASFRGTVFTASPESLRCLEELIGPKADVWSLGCIIWEACTLRRPFKAYNLMSFQNSSHIPSQFPLGSWLQDIPVGCPRNHRCLLRLVSSTLLVPSIDSRCSPIDARATFSDTIAS